MEQGRRHVLVVANETVGTVELTREVCSRCQGDEEVLVVSPALNSRLKHWVSDEDEARENAQQRLDASLATMEQAGVKINGKIGDADPLLAINDALRQFPADEIIIATHPEGRSNWLELGVISNARERFALPVHHVVADLPGNGE